MERTKEKKLVITFATTTASMAMEAACDPKWGRLIPVPREIHAGCGLAWCANPELEMTLTKFMKEKNLSYQQKQIVELYQ